MAGSFKFQWDAAPTRLRMIAAATDAAIHLETDALNWWDAVAPIGDDPRTRGDLRQNFFSSVTPTSNGVWLVFGSDVRYMVYVELGTGKMAPRAPLRTVAGEIWPFLEPYLRAALAGI